MNQAKPSQAKRSVAVARGHAVNWTRQAVIKWFQSEKILLKIMIIYFFCISTKRKPRMKQHQFIIRKCHKMHICLCVAVAVVIAYYVYADCFEVAISQRWRNSNNFVWMYFHRAAKKEYVSKSIMLTLPLLAFRMRKIRESQNQ